MKGYQGTVYEPYTCYQDSYPTTCYRPVKVYEQVLWQDYQSRRAIDVYIDGKSVQTRSLVKGRVLNTIEKYLMSFLSPGRFKRFSLWYLPEEK